MTHRSSIAAVVMTLLSLLAIAGGKVQAQTSDASVESIRASVVQALGVEDKTVGVSIIGNVLMVERVNSSLNEAGHGARDAEASRIAPVVAKAIADKLEFKKIHTIRVSYIARPKVAGAAKHVDTVDFRKDASGAFIFHAT